MIESMEFVRAMYVVRGLMAFVLALLLLTFYKRYRQSYLKHWTFSWLSLSIYYLAASISLFLAFETSATDPLRMMTSSIAGVMGYLQVGWLLFGAYELLSRSHVKRKTARWVLPMLAVLGLTGSLLFLGGSPGLRVFTRVGVYSLFSAGAFLIAGSFIWRADHFRNGFGYRLLAISFFAYSFGAISNFALNVYGLMGNFPSTVEVSAGMLDFLYLALMGLGMIATLLEDERQASHLALTEIEHLTYHDTVTGLPNRPFFMDRLIIATGMADRNRTKLGVLLIDLDRFKDINDSLGHYIGDAVLKVVAERLRSSLEKNYEDAVIARLGADEFAIMIPEVRDVEKVSQVADSLLESLKTPVEVQQMELYVTGSIGLSVYPDDADGAETLVRNADTAMYRAKDQGRDRHSVYASAMSQLAHQRLELENLLRKAIQNDEFVLHYQPLIEVSTNRAFGVEALIRWAHPTLGLIPPNDFIPLAEETGLIVQIGEWVLETACAEISKIQKVMGPDFSVSVNLSPRQFYQQDLPNKVSNILKINEIFPSALVLEITEGDAMRNAETTIETMNRLKRVGVKLAVDDFGTGYSSLDYLKRFPIDALKLDRTFVKDIETDNDDAAIATAVIAMAHSLGLKVVAEGVENEAQLGFLRKQRCDHIQGFFYSKALSFPDLRTYLAQPMKDDSEESLPS